MCTSDSVHAVDRLLGLVLTADAALDSEFADRQLLLEGLLRDLTDLVSDMRAAYCQRCALRPVVVCRDELADLIAAAGIDRPTGLAALPARTIAPHDLSTQPTT